MIGGTSVVGRSVGTVTQNGGYANAAQKIYYYWYTSAHLIKRVVMRGVYLQMSEIIYRINEIQYKDISGFVAFAYRRGLHNSRTLKLLR